MRVRRDGIRHLSARGVARRRCGALDPAAAAREDRLDRLAVRAEGLGLEEEAVHLAGELVALAGVAEGDALPLLLLVLAVLAAEQRGSARLPLPASGDPALAEALGVLLEGEPDHGGPGPDEALSRVEALLGGDAGLAAVVGGPDDYLPLIREGDALYTQTTRAREVRVGAGLADLLAAGEPAAEADEARAALADVLARPAGGLALSAEQQVAALTPLRAPGRLTAISGGPGTGKTSVVVAVLRLLSRIGAPPERIALAAPTGKAAKRLDQTVRAALAAVGDATEADADLAADLAPAKTLHRLLGAGPRGFWAGPERPLVHEWVVVDESSMASLALVDALLAALRPEARLVLIGDADQLPSVALGSVLADLVPATTTTAVPWAGLVEGALPADDPPAEAPRALACRRLTQNFRVAEGAEGRAVVEAAGAVRAGDPEALLAAVARRDDAADVSFAGVEGLLADLDRAALAAFLERWYARFVAGDAAHAARVERVYPTAGGRLRPADAGDLGAVLDHFAGARLLAVTNARTDALNATLHQRHLARRGLPSTTAFAPGEPLLMRRNDYDLGVMNGEVGVVLRVRDDPERPPRLKAVFRREDGRPVAAPLASLGDAVARVYASTVHKAQGDEFDAVAVVLDRPRPLATRNLLYTAITRARRAVTLVGPAEAFADAVRRPVRRSSGLGERLEG